MKNSRRLRSKSKKQVNPYYFFLAKRLAQFYYFGSQKSTDLQFVKKVYDRYKSPAFKSTTYIDAAQRIIRENDVVTIEKIEVDTYAMGFARRIHKILKTKDLCFTNSMLDNLVKEIRDYQPSENHEKYRVYRTWEEFIAKFKDDRGALEAEELCKKKNYVDLTPSEKDLIQYYVEYKCLKYYSRDQKFGHRYGIDGYMGYIEDTTHIIANTDSYTIRKAGYSEIDELASLANRLTKYRDRQRIEFMKRWMSAFEDSIFVYVDEYYLGGYTFLLPVTEQWFEGLIKGQKFTKPILHLDTIPTSKPQLFKTVLIESVEAVTLRAKALLKFYLPLMLEKLMCENGQDFDVIFIGTEEDVQGLMPNLGFNASDTTLWAENIQEIKTLYRANGRALINNIGG